MNYTDNMIYNDSVELDPLAFILDHPDFNFKPLYHDIPEDGRPYTDLDFLQTGLKSVLDFHDRTKWIQYYGYCNTLFASNQISVIHKAKSTASLMVMNKFRILLNEFCADPDEVLFQQVLPFVTRNVMLHEEHHCTTIEEFKRTLQQLTADLIIH